MKNKTCGIYVITERVTERAIYVGQSLGIEGRWEHHKGSKGNYPQERFDYRIIQECLPAELNFWEKYYIRALKTHWTEGGENQDWGGQRWPKPEEPLSPAVRAKISATLTGRTHSAEHRAKNSAAKKGRTGRVQSEETRAKISAAKKGVTHSAEHRAKNSAAQKGRPPPNKGVPMSEEQKAKCSEALTGRTHSEELRAKNSAAQKAVAARKRAAKAAAVAALEALLILETETILSPE